MVITEVSRAAVDDLERLIVANDLPDDTRERFATSLRVLESFPQAGPKLTGAWSEFRFWIGPWPWMIAVYEHLRAATPLSLWRSTTGADLRRRPRVADSAARNGRGSNGAPN